MKTNPKVFLALLFLVTTLACKKEDFDPPDENPSAVVVEMEDDAAFLENAGAQTIDISFSKAAFQSGTIELKVTTDTPNAFQTTPATVEGKLTLTVAKGADEASFTFTPVNNNLLDDERTLSFELTKVSSGFVLGTRKRSVVTILDDEVAAAVSANFSTETAILLENTQAGLQVDILLSGPTLQAGKIMIELDELPAATILTTEPAINAQGLIELSVPVGARNTSFKLIPTNDNLLKGHHMLGFTIAATEGGITKGTATNFELQLLDDELSGKARSYESVGGGWRSMKTYTYEESGRVRSVYWERETPIFSSGTETYYYADNGLIERVNRHPQIDEYFIQENGRIIRSETIQNGIKTAYSEFDYDAAGNLGAQANYYRQSSGAYQLGLLFVYLYHDDGNIYRQLTYNPAQDPNNPTLLSTRTYAGYMDVANPFPNIEVIPNLLMQRHLPLSYQLDENGSLLTASFSYEFRDDGRPNKRITSGGLGSEVTSYTYW